MNNLINRIKRQFSSQLLRKEHISYLLEWNKLLGNKKKVLYNAMGPDLSTVLLFANPTEIIGVDPKGFFRDTEEYVLKFWDFIDIKPIVKSGDSWYHSEKNTAKSYKPTEEELYFFKENLKFRKNYGYWDITHIRRWGLDRLLMIELKKLNVDPGSIKFNSNPFQISFEWAYPKEKAKERKLIYLPGTLDKVFDGIKEIDCYYQKSLPNPSDTLTYLNLVLPNLSSKSVVALGYILNDRPYGWKNNEQFSQDVKKLLGDRFYYEEGNKKLNNLIDQIPDDVNDPYNQYGMKLHIFRSNHVNYK